MTKRMLIDATHSEETRVAVVDGNRLIDFDYESKVRKQLKGSIFLAKVTRVEPSLQAAFVNFGGNRHGFLPFTEIHPDYYRIPIADREALLAEQERELEERLAQEEAEDAEDTEEDNEDEIDEDEELDLAEDTDQEGLDEETEKDEESSEDSIEQKAIDRDDKTEHEHEDDDVNGNVKTEDDDSAPHQSAWDKDQEQEQGSRKGNYRGRNQRGGRGRSRYNNKDRGRNRGKRMATSSRRVETVGGDGIEGDQPIRPSLRKNYKIQEVVKRGQIMLIQVNKEERGNKGAAVSTYLSLPGRYCVLMPNSPRAGGVSRKVANYKERKRMREILAELKVPDGMSVIMRTAGVSRTKAEIKRDLDYLMKLWDNIRELTLSSTAPAIVHEEGNLIRRSIRDIYAPDIEDVLVAGTEGHKFAKNFMKMMIPSHAKKVQEYKDEKIPLFHRYQVESQINEIGNPVVTLPSGGYLVINPTEALISVDVNSGRATKERHIEETALRTNLEAADEVARQLKLRDLGGLVVIDFIDMEDRRNNRKVENRTKDALSGDRARIQIGRISSFGLLELSRQRLNPSLTEAQHEKCPHCAGVGHVRTIDATAIMALRALEEEGIRERSETVSLKVATTVALYILNNKRDMLADIEKRYNFTVTVDADATLPPSNFEVTPLNTRGNDESSKREDKKDEESPQQDQEKSSRRRGRRGGRRRNNRKQGDDAQEKDNEESIVDGAKPKNSETVAADDAQKETKDNKEGKTKRKSSKTPKPAAEKSSNKGKEAEAKNEKKTPKTRKKKKDDETKSETVKTEENITKITETSPPSNDTNPQDKGYETVNEPPEKKKKGWWNKFTE